MFNLKANTQREAVQLLGEVLDFACNVKQSYGEPIFKLYAIYRAAKLENQTFGQFVESFATQFEAAVERLSMLDGFHLSADTALGDCVATRSIPWATEFLLGFKPSAKETRSLYRKNRSGKTAIPAETLIGITPELQTEAA